MVRTPLARRIASSEDLNAVSLYLPHYDAKSVEQVVARLRTGEDQIAAEITTDAVLCRPNPSVPDAVWNLAEMLPTYTRPAKVHRSDVARLNTFAHLLATTQLEKDAPSKAREHLVATLDREAKRLGDELDKTAAEYARLDYEQRTVTVLDLGGEDVVAEGHVAVSDRNVEDLFRRAKRQLGDAAATWYWNALCDAQEAEGDQEADAVAAKIRVAALASDPSVPEALEKAAAELIANWRNTHYSALTRLPEADRDKAYRIFQQSRDPQLVTVILPDDINATAPAGTPKHDKHLYANGNGKYPGKFNEWERGVLDVELPDAIAWYRNPVGGARAIGVPYALGGDAKTMYPDFVFFYETEDGIVADIIDPHDPSRTDTAPKWAGLAAFATEHRDTFRRVLAVIRGDDGVLASLDLRNQIAASKLTHVSTEGEIRQLFKDYGGRYD
jgi:type III restriction enzyme